MSYWDNVSTEAEEDAGLAIAEAMNSAGSYFSREYGFDTSEWLWGKVHTVTLNAAIISDAGVKDYNNGPYPNHGGLHTVDVANPRSLYSRQFEHGAGASMRFVCEMTSPPTRRGVCLAVSVIIVIAHTMTCSSVGSAREPTPMPFSDAEIDAVTTESLTGSYRLIMTDWREVTDV